MEEIIRIRQNFDLFVLESDSECNIFYIKQNNISLTMGGQASGALNARGFSESIKQKRLPHHDHLTYNGIFNENFFEVGDRAKDLL